MTREAIANRIAEITRKPVHLREFEEKCVLNSLSARLASMNAYEGSPAGRADRAATSRKLFLLNVERTTLNFILEYAEELEARGVPNLELAHNKLWTAVADLYCSIVERRSSEKLQ